MSIINYYWYGCRRPPHMFLKPSKNNFKFIGYQFTEDDGIEMFIVNDTIIRDTAETNPHYFEIDKSTQEIIRELTQEEIDTVRWKPARIEYDPNTNLTYEILGDNNRVVLKEPAQNKGDTPNAPA